MLRRAQRLLWNDTSMGKPMTSSRNRNHRGGTGSNRKVVLGAIVAGVLVILTACATKIVETETSPTIDHAGARALEVSTIQMAAAACDEGAPSRAAVLVM